MRGSIFEMTDEEIEREFKKANRNVKILVGVALLALVGYLAVVVIAL